MVCYRYLLHRERRKFLRTALKELALILADQPGLLGPKVQPTVEMLLLLKDLTNQIFLTIKYSWLCMDCIVISCGK